MKIIVSIKEQAGIYYQDRWDININVNCKRISELKELISKLEDVVKTIKGKEK